MLRSSLFTIEFDLNFREILAFMDIENELKNQPLEKIQSSLYSWYQKHRSSYPWRTFWIEMQDPWPVWVSEVMLQQTLIAAVIPKYLAFMKRFPNVRSFAEASEEEIRPFVAGMGYYRRFSLLSKGSKEVLRQGFPKNRHEWLNISGVGPYTAAAIASITLAEKVGVVDGNVERVMARLFNIQEIVSQPKWKKKFFTIMDQLAKHPSPGDINQSVMELGQTICKVAKPICEECPIQKYCLAFKKKSQHLAPASKDSFVFEPVNLNVHLHIKNGKVFLEKRDAKKIFLKGSIGFPFQLTDQLKASTYKTIKHSITKFKISASIILSPAKKGTDGIWVPFEKIDDTLISALDHKIWRAFNH